ncbi:hypothetical protein QF026_008275 [Streptomyces aurantiacus]|nr:hypothetical protein [Streptomyces aurantiacus]
MKVFYRGERVVLAWDGLSAHWSRAMRAWAAEQDWLTLERLPCRATRYERRTRFARSTSSMSNSTSRV